MVWTDEELDKYIWWCEEILRQEGSSYGKELIDEMIEKGHDLISELRLARKSAATWKRAAKLYRKSNNDAMEIIGDMIEENK